MQHIFTVIPKLVWHTTFKYNRLACTGKTRKLALYHITDPAFYN